MTVERLKRYRQLVTVIEDIENDMRRIGNQLTDLKATSYDRPVVAASHDAGEAIVAAIDKLEELERMHKTRTVELLGVQSDVLIFLYSIDDPVDYQIMKYRYINGMRWEDIALAMGYSDSTVKHRHGAVMTRNFGALWSIGESI